MSTNPPIEAPTDYATARQRFLDRVASLGGAVRSHLHPRTGPAGEEVATDVARFGPGPGDARNVVVVASGLHGVEGHAGSALQRLALAEGVVDGLPDDTALVMIHAINPFGMAWDRRVDHDNTDVNRNFVDFDAPLPENPGYADVAAALNPADWDPDDIAWQGEILGYAADVGQAAMFHAVSGGQYTVPDGVQFGGRGPGWSRTMLEAVWGEHLAGAERAWNVDLHTGLGAYAGLLTFQTADITEPSATITQPIAEHYYRVDRTVEGEAIQIGVVGPGLEAFAGRELPGTLIVPITLEWGVHDEVRTLTAMRADNWLHNRSDPAAGEHAERIRAMMREVFAPDAEDWRQKVADDGLGALRRILASGLA